MSSFLHVTKLHNIYVNDVAYYYKTIFNCIIFYAILLTVLLTPCSSDIDKKYTP